MTPQFQTEPEISLADAATLAVWPVLLVIGAAGLLISYGRPLPQPAKDVPIVPESLQVELTSEPLPVPAAALPPAAQPPPADALLAPAPPALALAAVAEPSKVAFALPVEGPVRLVETKHAAFAARAVRPETPAPAAVLPPAQELVYGQGEGRQPAPDYPFRARREGQEGVVRVRFSVGESGLVLSADASSPSPWPLLNEAATRVVRERWRFRPGTLRLYEVSIRFQLTR